MYFSEFVVGNAMYKICEMMDPDVGLDSEIIACIVFTGYFLTYG